MSKKIRFEITSSGKIYAKTIGMHGEECLDFVEMMEQLVDGETVDSSFTEEYFELPLKQKVQEKNELRGE